MNSIRGQIVRGIAVMALLGAAATQALPQEGTLARAAVKEVLKALGRQAEKSGAKAAAKELAEFGGETAVREVFELVAKESGEVGVKNLVRLTEVYGMDAIRAAKVAPRVTSVFIDRVPVELAPGALRALARTEERAVIERIDSELIPGALEAAARHPGVGAEVVEKLGVAGVSASQRFDTDVLIQLARSGEAAKIPMLPFRERKVLLSAIADFVEAHPKMVLTGAALGVFLKYKAELLGGKGKILLGPDGRPVYVPEPGMIERETNKILEWILPVIAAIVGAWGINRVFWAWKLSKLSHNVKSAGLNQSPESGGR